MTFCFSSSPPNCLRSCPESNYLRSPAPSFIKILISFFRFVHRSSSCQSWFVDVYFGLDFHQEKLEIILTPSFYGSGSLNRSKTIFTQQGGAISLLTTRQNRSKAKLISLFLDQSFDNVILIIVVQLFIIVSLIVL